MATAQIASLDSTLELFEKRSLSKESPRWLFLALNLIEPYRKNEMDHLRPTEGGEEFSTPCLHYSAGLLHRGRVQPLVLAPRWTPPDLILEGTSLLDLAPSVDMDAKWTTSLAPTPALPGDEVKGIIQSARESQRKPVSEVTPLAGMRHGEVVREFGGSPFAKFFFQPQGMAPLPKTLRELRDEIEQAMRATGESALRKVGEILLQNCDESRLWGTRVLEDEHALLRMGVHASGYSHRYSGLAETLLEQLEVERKDGVYAKQADATVLIADILEKTLGNKGDSEAGREAMLAKLIENQNVVMAKLAEVLGPSQKADESKPEPKPAPAKK